MKILRILTICCYLSLSIPYVYGTVPAKIDLTIDSEIAAFPSAPPTTHIYELLKQGDDYHDNSQYFQAIASYKEALQKYPQNHEKRPLLLAKIYNNMGMSYLALKNYIQTYFCYDKALTIRKLVLERAISGHNEPLKQDISEAIGKSHHNLGILYLATSKPKEAIQSFQAALATEWQHHVEAVDTQLHLTKAYQTQKEFDKAILQPEISTVAASSRTERKNSIRNWEVGIGNYISYFSKASQTQKRLDKAILQPELSTVAASSCAPRRNLARHQESNTFGARAKQSEVPTKGVRTEHSKVSPKKSFSCPICQKKFFRKDNMQIHLRVHTGKKPYKCIYCQKKFSKKQNMKKHLRVHTGERPFACPVCDKKFAQKQHMKVHLRIHTGEKNFTCPVCYKKFARKDTMKNHMKRIHTSPTL